MCIRDSEYTYDENGLLIQTKQSNNGKVYRLESITYNAQNNISEKTICMPGSTVADTIETYFYTSENVLERYESKSGHTKMCIRDSLKAMEMETVAG